MKTVLWGLGIVIVGAGLFYLGWASRGAVTHTDSPVASIVKSAPAPVPANAPAPLSQHTPSFSQSDFERFNAAKDAALQASPDLAAEYKEIIHGIQIQQTRMDAAMIEADPKVAPIIAKLVELRKRNGTSTSSATAGTR